MSSVSFPFLPIGQLVHCALGDHKMEPDLRTTRWTKIPTQHEFTIYNGTVFLANTSLLVTISLVIVTVASYLHPVIGIGSTLLAYWIHASASTDCQKLSAKIMNPLEGSLHALNSYHAICWKSESCNVFGVISWHQYLPTVNQKKMNELPECLSTLRYLQGFSSVQNLDHHWRRVHEKNRPFLRTFFQNKSAEFSGDDRWRLLGNITQTHLIERTAQIFLAKPRTLEEMERFLG